MGVSYLFLVAASSFSSSFGRRVSLYSCLPCFPLAAPFHVLPFVHGGFVKCECAEVDGNSMLCQSAAEGLGGFRHFVFGVGWAIR